MAVNPEEPYYSAIVRFIEWIRPANEARANRIRDLLATSHQPAAYLYMMIAERQL